MLFASLGSECVETSVKTIDVAGVWQENNVVETEKTIEALKRVA